MTVDLAVGDERRVLLVVGDRTWRQDGSVTPPEPFEQMPLVYARAYGGTVVADDEECVHPTNPGGRGFVASTKHLGGTRLPNLEWPDDRLQSWADRPEVAGFSALSASSPLQLSRSVRVDAAAALGFRVTRSLYSCAHPRLVFCDAPVGTPLRLDGVGAGPIHFRVPAGVAAVDVGLGKRRHVLVPRLDTIGILADERRVALTWRASFRYVLVRHELRTTSVRLTNAEASR